MRKNTCTPESILAPNTRDWVSRRIADEVVVMPLRPARNENSRLIYSFSNRTAVFLWEMIDGRSTAASIIRSFTERFSGRKETIETEIAEALGDLLGAGLAVTSGAIKSRPDTRVSKHKTLRQKYITPEIAAIRMRPEQSVLSCCVNVLNTKMGFFQQCDLDAKCVGSVPCDVQGKSFHATSSAVS